MQLQLQLSQAQDLLLFVFYSLHKSVSYTHLDVYKRQINKLRREKNAVILSHFYVDGALQDIADYVGDSLGLAQAAAKTDADMIVFVGVHFMAETAKIINPHKKVILPDLKAGCSLAISAPAEEFAKFKAKYPGHKVITYVNATAALKTMSDIVCTSANAKQIVESFPPDEKLIFAPDKNLGNYINSITGRNMVLWDGTCICLLYTSCIGRYPGRCRGMVSHFVCRIVRRGSGS